MDNGLFTIALIFMVIIFVGILYLILTEPKRKNAKFVLWELN